jgi:hypothetical protein
MDKKTLTFVGFNQGQYGDLFIQLVPAKMLKCIYEGCRVIFSVNKKYEDVIDVLKLSEDIDDFIVWDGYDDWPTEKDKQKMSEFDGEFGRLFNPMQKNSVLDWHNYWHITEEACVRYRLPRPADHIQDFKIPKPDVEKENTVCIAGSASGEVKSFTEQQIEIIKKFCKKKDLEPILLGGPEDKGVDGIEKFEGNYSESVFKMIKSRFLVSADTGMVWAASAFSHHVLGLYCMDSETKASSHENWTPKNKNQKTVVSKSMADITEEILEEELEEAYIYSK